MRDVSGFVFYLFAILEAKIFELCDKEGNFFFETYGYSRRYGYLSAMFLRVERYVINHIVKEVKRWLIR